MEPQWMQKISSNTVCDWFYFFFVVNLIVALLSVGKIIFMAVKSRMLTTVMGVLSLLIVIAVLGISVTNSLFFYLICDRGLKPEGSRFLSAVRPDAGQGNTQANYVYRPSSE